ncbi:MAG: TatD family hydrolase [Alphaproteobacteria bacterium]|nr:TatD family hydrolase [Alphaproteobacteria bacterium]
MGLFDVHAHLTDRRLAAREAEVLANARAAGVTTIISNGLNPPDNERVLALAARSDLVKPAIGLYPVDAVLTEMEAMGTDYKRDASFDPEEALQYVEDHVDQCVAIGEIGLDHYWVPSELWDLQEQRFRRLVKLAMEADKPIIIHTRKAEQRTFDVLVEMGATRVNWHCYSSKVKLGMRIAAHGHWLSIPANVRKSDNFRRLLEGLPREKVLLETDCPYLGPEKGELNEPANVAVTAGYAAELWNTSADAVQAQLEANFEALFGFAP